MAEAGNIHEGKRLAETAAFDLALLDANVGGESILSVAEIIERRGVPFLFVTGMGKMAFRHRSVKDWYYKNHLRLQS